MPPVGLRRKGASSRVFQTINGAVVVVRNYFWAKGQGVYPADAALNADSHGMSAGIREAIAMLAATMEFRGTSQTIKRLSGINLCAETCRQVTLREGYRIAEVIKDGTLTPSFQPEQAVVTPRASRPGCTWVSMACSSRPSHRARRSNGAKVTAKDG